MGIFVPFCYGCLAIFFRVGKAIRGLQMNLECQALINELADYQPCTAMKWTRLSSLADIHQLTTLAAHWRAMGLIAWGERAYW